MILNHLKEAPNLCKVPVAGTAEGISIRTISTIGIPRTELPANDTDYSYERNRSITKNTPVGLQPYTHEECKNERKIAKKYFKEYTANVFKLDAYKAGITFPIEFSDTRTYLERCADLFSFLATQYIDKAIKLKNDPKEASHMLAYITAGVVSALHIDINCKKLFNPYVGETFVGRWPNGATLYAEQSYHHPPVSDYEIIGPNNGWYCSAHTSFDVSTSINQIEIKQNGTFTLKIKDGPVYEWTFPTATVSGILKDIKTVRVKGEIKIVDTTNKLVSHVEMCPNLKKIPSNHYFHSMKEANASTVYGEITSLNSKNEKKNKSHNNNKHNGSHHHHDENCENIFYGDYCKELYFNNEKIWDINENFAQRPIKTISDDLLLPSDSRYRYDRYLFIEGKQSEAEKAKLALETIQRREEKLRNPLKKGK